ncbi:hypothetical protein IQ273_08350 [Nodosilinea sp. LEGE 07298]|uniref:hypothetical protein n=1 Tax=Nodosilinea sp. LEGE 07298 TaxID=2777970 RepID=UPI0018808480|nr:hypothetical protein [Nodosilinea sp. LEGE 07298]MBE9109425.1 hypothetical protein [Nodosilinea sp. LEGE 07298]
MEQVYQFGKAPIGGKPLADILVETVLQTGSQALAEQFLKGWQWAFANLLEMAMLLTGSVDIQSTTPSCKS